MQNGYWRLRTGFWKVRVNFGMKILSWENGIKKRQGKKCELPGKHCALGLISSSTGQRGVEEIIFDGDKGSIIKFSWACFKDF